MRKPAFREIIAFRAPDGFREELNQGAELQLTTPGALIRQAVARELVRLGIRKDPAAEPAVSRGVYLTDREDAA
jgi:hypothetical protein